MKILKELVILIIGGIIFIIFGIIGIIYTLFKHILKWDYSINKQLVPIIRSITLLFDGFANAGAGELLNDILKVNCNSNIKYGKWYQTISAITGLRLYIDTSDNKFRRILDKILGKDHCTEAISVEDLFYYKNNKNEK